MIEYIQNTGLVSRKEDFNNLGRINDGIGFIASQDPLINDVYINGQTLLETEADLTVVGQQEIITHTGDFFLSGSSLRSSTGFADFSIHSLNLSDIWLLNFDVSATISTMTITWSVRNILQAIEPFALKMFPDKQEGDFLIQHNSTFPPMGRLVSFGIHWTFKD